MGRGNEFEVHLLQDQGKWKYIYFCIIFLISENFRRYISACAINKEKVNKVLMLVDKTEVRPQLQILICLNFGREKKKKSNVNWKTSRKYIVRKQQNSYRKYRCRIEVYVLWPSWQTLVACYLQSLQLSDVQNHPAKYYCYLTENTLDS